MKINTTKYFTFRDKSGNRMSSLISKIIKERIDASNLTSRAEARNTKLSGKLSDLNSKMLSS